VKTLLSYSNSQSYIGFSSTEKLAQYLSDDQNKDTTTCEKNKLIFRLDQKSINESGCNYEGNIICTFVYNNLKQ